jgi:hypothetical protein
MGTEESPPQSMGTEPSDRFSGIRLKFIGIGKLFINYSAVYAEGGYDFNPIVIHKVDNSVMKAESRVGKPFLHHEQTISKLFLTEFPVDFKCLKLDCARVGAKFCGQSRFLQGVKDRFFFF